MHGISRSGLITVSPGRTKLTIVDYFTFIDRIKLGNI